MNETLFVGLTGAFGIYAVTSAIPRARRGRSLALAFVLTVAFFVLFYGAGAQHFSLPDRLVRGIINGTLVGAAGVVVALLKHRRKT